MGNRKQAPKGRRPPYGEDIANIVEGMAKAIELRILILPRCTHHYRNAIWSAFDGNMEPIGHALNRLKQHAHNFGNSISPTSVLAKWKASMTESYEGTYYVLSMFQQLLTEYHKVHHGSSNKLSKGIAGVESGIANQELSAAIKTSYINL